MKQQYTLFAILTMLGLLIMIQLHAQQDWELKKDKDGIKVYVRTIPGNIYKEFKGECLMDASIEKVNKILEDVPNQVNWILDFIVSRAISKDQNTLVQYNVIKGPLLIDDRDVIIKTTIQRSPDRILRSFTAIPMESIPRRKRTVRMLNVVGKWEFIKQGDKTLVIYQNLTDPGGFVPSSLVNLNAVKIPFVSLKCMRSQLSNPKFN